MSALAGLLKQKGYHIAGSDVAAYPPVGPLLASLNIPVCLQYDLEDLKRFRPDYVVIGNFVRRDNPQAVYTLEQKIPYGSFPSTLEDFFLNQTKNYVVTGTHGKSTTTACLAHLLAHAKHDPSFLVGGIPVNFEKSFHVGSGREFVIEGDEYDTAFFDKESKFLHYRPTVGFLNSLEFDHADIFPNNEAMEKMFRKFLGIVDPEGRLYYCRDWERVGEIVKEETRAGHLRAKAEGYGFHQDSDHRIESFSDSPKGMKFKLWGMDFECAMTGRFNAQNFAAALLGARHAGVSMADLQRGLASFRGVKRRQEVVGTVGEHIVIDDFAHHPTAVHRVLEGLRAKYPNHRVVTFFEPRSNTSRRNILQKEFESAFILSDLTLISELFRVESIPEAERLSLKSIEDAHRERGKAIFAGISQDEMIRLSVDEARQGPCLMVVLSNGSFDGLHQKLISALKLL